MARTAPVAAGDDVRFRLRRTTVRPGFSVVELSGSYDGGATWRLGVQLAEWDGDRIVRERIYVMDGFEAPESRQRWPRTGAGRPVSRKTSPSRSSQCTLIDANCLHKLLLEEATGGIGDARTLATST